MDFLLVHSLKQNQANNDYIKIDLKKNLDYITFQSANTNPNIANIQSPVYGIPR